MRMRRTCLELGLGLGLGLGARVRLRLRVSQHGRCEDEAHEGAVERYEALLVRVTAGVRVRVRVRIRVRVIGLGSLAHHGEHVRSEHLLEVLGRSGKVERQPPAG